MVQFCSALDNGLMEAVFTDEQGSECGRLRLDEEDTKFFRPSLEECRASLLIVRCALSDA